MKYFLGASMIFLASCNEVVAMDCDQRFADDYSTALSSGNLEWFIDNYYLEGVDETRLNSLKRILNLYFGLAISRAEIGDFPADFRTEYERGGVKYRMSLVPTKLLTVHFVVDPDALSVITASSVPVGMVNGRCYVAAARVDP